VEVVTNGGDGGEDPVDSREMAAGLRQARPAAWSLASGTKWWAPLPRVLAALPRRRSHAPDLALPQWPAAWIRFLPGRLGSMASMAGEALHPHPSLAGAALLPPPSLDGVGPWPARPPPAMRTRWPELRRWSPWLARLRAASGHKERVDLVFSSNFLFVLVQEVGIRLQVNSLCKQKHLSFEAHQVVK